MPKASFKLRAMANGVTPTLTRFSPTTSSKAMMVAPPSLTTSSSARLKSDVRRSSARFATTAAMVDCRVERSPASAPSRAASSRSATAASKPAAFPRLATVNEAWRSLASRKPVIPRSVSRDALIADARPAASASTNASILASKAAEAAPDRLPHLGHQGHGRACRAQSSGIRPVAVRIEQRTCDPEALGQLRLEDVEKLLQLPRLCIERADDRLEHGKSGAARVEVERRIEQNARLQRRDAAFDPLERCLASGHLVTGCRMSLQRGHPGQALDEKTARQRPESAAAAASGDRRR
jgi:hypothetical protein